jgi:hypothetical protein
MKQIGKIVNGVQYIHNTLISKLSDDDWGKYYLRARTAIESVLGNPSYPLTFKPVIISIDRKKGIVSFTECPEWDNQYEPSVGSRFTVKFAKKPVNDQVKFTKANKKNPQIYHRRHLFVAPDYDGFDIESDKLRVTHWHKLSPDGSRMGRRIWWDNFCKTNNL